jgi:uncharacterized membrane protein
VICNNCGKQVTENVNFCDGCGAPMNEQLDVQASLQKAPQKDDAQENKVVFMLAYLGILFFLPLVSTPNSTVGRFHANQGLVILLTGIAGQIVLSILGVLLWRLWFVISLLSTLWGILLLVLMIIGMVNANKGEQNPLPIIGNVKILK